VDLFEKCRQYTKPRQAEAIGCYPYFIPIQSPSGPEVIIRGQNKIMLGSNNYLGLTQHPYVIEKTIKAVEMYGTGCTGSRLLNGTLEMHEELEQRLARFVRQEAALVFTTGYQVNVGVISALVGRNDVVVTDRADHASILDGCRLSFGKTVKYSHNNMSELERVLSAQEGERGILVVIDGVFSMEGDIANLPEVVRLCKQYNARIMVDDAHGVGVLGERGSGTAEHFGLESEVDLIMGTFSKSFASTGGFIAGDAEVIYFIKHAARALLFSAAIPPASAAAALASLDIIESEPERRGDLWTNMRFWKNNLTEVGFDTGHSETPIVPIVIGEDMRTALLWRRLFDDGVFVNTAVSPAVEPGRALLRTSVMATHTEDQLSRALDIVTRAGREFGLVT
jgi:8-amino-7-oxononanoate synthase